MDLTSLEKFRPTFIDDVVGQEEAVRIVMGLAARVPEGGVFPHLLFHGPPGCGKTTLAYAVARSVLGFGWRDNFLELNASDERGIAMVQGRLKPLVNQAVAEAPFRIVFLDEADSLTRDAQDALRRIIEQASHTTRFILSCNRVSKLTEAIRSRCAVVPFKPLNETAIRTILHQVSESEKLQFSKEMEDSIVIHSRGDARRAIHLLLEGEETTGLQQTDDVVKKFLAGGVGPEDVTAAFRAAGISDWESVLENMADMVVASELHKERKARMLIDIGLTAYRCNAVAVPLLQIRSMMYGWHP
jgi:replication factor C small subunit